MTDLHYLQLLSRSYPTALAASAEIINLNAICCLPKGTEYFFSDLHGEYDAFSYLLSSASGILRDKIEDLFSRSVSEKEREELAMLIYSPADTLARFRSEMSPDAYDNWCRIAIYRLVQVCKVVSSKYTRSKVRKKIPGNFSYVIDELLHADTEENKERYYEEIIRSIVSTGTSDAFITQFCALIQECSVDMLHILGDIFDRGPHADRILDELRRFHDVDIQWGNHDIAWMGAYLGNQVCVASVLRRGVSYNNFDLLEDGYGINLRPLSMFAAAVYGDDPCTRFAPHVLDENIYDPVDTELASKMHKAMAVIEMKLEGQLLRRHPEYEMDDRILLPRINFDEWTVEVDGKSYAMLDQSFPTIDPADPLALTPGEQELIDQLTASFRHSNLLRKHMRFLLSKGSMYKVVNGNLLYHGCIPMKPDGSFDEVPVDGRAVKGKEYLDVLSAKVRLAFYGEKDTPEHRDAVDLFWYLWAGPRSPLFGKSKISAFERYFIAEPETHVEIYNPYYTLVDHREVCEMILREFGLSAAHSHIVNGHVPVKEREGESPIRGGGLLFVIDGGISKAYQRQTGFGGYTLIYNSHHLALAQHKPYNLIKNNPRNSAPKVRIVEAMPKRVLVGDTDTGARLREQIRCLQDLLSAYRDGTIKEQGE
ncbi:MAG: fructose-1,6-bisphosphatase [Lachnospirales bacterium]